ncbi:MAG: alkylhydroperoxidase family enzyme, partial [Bacillariaceae sp.]
NAGYQASDRGKATKAAYDAAYQASDNGKATKAAYQASDRGKATIAEYQKTRLENKRAETALLRAATNLVCVYCNARYYSTRGINDHQKQCRKK